MNNRVEPNPGQGDIETFLVFAAMRNEGAFLLEWVCWYRMLGFSIIVGINDCSDRSGPLLKRLSQAGWLTYFRHVPPSGVPPKRSAHKALRKRAEIDQASWLLICDVDEFLVLHRGDGGIKSFVEHVGRANLGIAFHWKTFGNSNKAKWNDEFVHRAFLNCGPSKQMPNAAFKTMVRNPSQFGYFSEHSPRNFEGVWGDLPNNIVDSSGRPISQFITEPHPIKETDVENIVHRDAQLNHYAIKFDECYDLKRGTLSASAFKDRYTQTYYDRRNINQEYDDCALRYSERFDRVYAEAISIPGVLSLHHLNCADYVARICDQKQTDPRKDPRWAFHKERAQELTG